MGQVFPVTRYVLQSKRPADSILALLGSGCCWACSPVSGPIAPIRSIVLSSTSWTGNAPLGAWTSSGGVGGIWGKWCQDAANNPYTEQFIFKPR